MASPRPASISDLRGAWRGRRVLVTGHTGFKGSWLCLWLQSLGAKVTGFALESPTEPNLFSRAGVAEGMDSVHGDVRNLEALLAVLRQAQPEVVFHLAAQSLVRESYEQPIETFATNVMGTVNLLEAIRRRPGVRAALMVTSDKCYENQEWVWPYRENEAMGGHDPYSASKGCAELVTSAYRRSFFADSDDPPSIASARAGNVIGGGDWANDRLIPDLLRGLVHGEPIHLRSPAAVRPWQHVLEALHGYLLLAEHLLEHGSSYAEGWNFGPDDSDTRTVQWIVETLAERWLARVGQEVKWSMDPGPHPHEAHSLSLDSSKARNRLSWRPRLGLELCLDWIVEWFRVYRMAGDVRGVTLEQIERFDSLPKGC